MHRTQAYRCLASWLRTEISAPSLAWPGARAAVDLLRQGCSDSAIQIQYATKIKPGDWAWIVPFGVAASSILTLQHAHTQRELEPETLVELARDLHGQHYADRERSVASISTLTLYVEHHEQLLAAGVLPALMATVRNQQTVSQLRIVALTSTADLMKNTAAHQAVREDSAFLSAVLQAVRGEGGWQEGPEDGAMARTQAIRLFSELAASPDMQGLLVSSGAAAALAAHGSFLAHESMKEDKTYSSMAAVPGNMAELLEVEEERFAAAALFGMAGSDACIKVILQTDDASAVDGMIKWTRSNDPVLRRYGAGGLSRTISASPNAFEAVDAAGGIPALVNLLASSDGQTACFASGAIGKLATQEGKYSVAVLKHGAAPQLVAMLTQEHKGQSAGVKVGVQRCALRAIMLCLGDAQLRSALQQAHLAETLQVLSKSPSFSNDSELASLAADATRKL